MIKKLMNKYALCNKNNNGNLEVSVKEYVTKIQGSNFTKLPYSLWEKFALKIVESLEVKKCKNVNVEIYRPDIKFEMPREHQPYLPYERYEVCVFIDKYNKVLTFNGIDCVSDFLDKEAKKQLNDAWRELLGEGYGIKDEIIETLNNRKLKLVTEIEGDYNEAIESLRA